jgi:GAF domain-containing protein
MTDSAERLAKAFVEVSDTLADNLDLSKPLQMLTQRVVDLVGAAAAGVMLADPDGHLHFMAASDENARFLELFQVQRNEGPCLDAFRTVRPVTHLDLTNAEVRWPVFAPRAAAAGYRSVHAIPLRRHGEVLGALNVFGATAGAGLDEANAQIAQGLADAAAIGLLQQRVIRHGQLQTEQLQHALNSRIVIEQAKGIIARAHGVTVDEAFTMIRSYARSRRRRLVEVANDIVADPSNPPDLAQSQEVKRCRR